MLYIIDGFNQAAVGQELLDMARDYSHFVTKFFEVIKVSAPHIYHSALELSPESSRIRKCYHHHPFRGSRPLVVCGLPHSWYQPLIIPGTYGSCAWSPCGQYFAAQTSTSIEVWDVRTGEKHLSLPLTNLVAADTWYLDLLAYSPDAYSLAGCFGSIITIWDMQTGGVVGEIKCEASSQLPVSLVWSLDGSTIGVIFPAEVGTWVVGTYDVVLEVEVSATTLLSLSEPCIWADDNSLRTMTIQDDRNIQVISHIFKVHPMSANKPIETFHVGPISLQGDPVKISFSPSTYRISILTSHGHYLFNIQDLKLLLYTRGYLAVNSLSSDGNVLLVSRHRGGIGVWKYSPKRTDYAYWGTFGFEINTGQPATPQGYRLSPLSSSVLISRMHFLEVQLLEVRPIAPQKNRHCIGYSSDGAYVVMMPTDKFDQTITITNLHKGSSQLFYIAPDVCSLALTGNILLVYSNDRVAGWRLTVEGAVDRVFDNGVEDHNDGRLWTKPILDLEEVMFQVEGNIGAIKLSEDFTFYYDTETGRELDSVPVMAPLHSWNTTKVDQRHVGKYSLRGPRGSFNCHNFVEWDCPPECSPEASIPRYKEGWVIYPEGEHQHRFWLPACWRLNWNQAQWFDNTPTLWIDMDSGPVIITF